MSPDAPPSPSAPLGADVPQSLDLCASGDLPDGGRALLFDVLWNGAPQRAFVLRQGGAVVAYLNRCAHVPAELDWNPGEFLDADRRSIVCSIHGAEYEPHSGRCVGGPCGRGRLIPVTVHDNGARVAWYPSADIQPLTFA